MVAAVQILVKRSSWVRAVIFPLMPIRSSQDASQALHDASLAGVRLMPVTIVSFSRLEQKLNGGRT
jgi:hypothetical protein